MTDKPELGDIPLGGQDNSEAFFETALVANLVVRSFSVRQRLSSPTEIEVVAASPVEIDDLGALAAAPATLTLRHHVPSRGTIERCFDGVVLDSSRLHRELAGLTRYAFKVCSDIALLRYGRNSRIYQYKSELDIVEELLQKWQISFVSEVDRPAYPTRKYKVQRNETDYAFLHRLLEELGISYGYRREEERTVMVLSDAMHRSDERIPPLVHRPAHSGLETKRDYASDTQEYQQTAQTRYTVRDSDHRRNAAIAISETAATPDADSFPHHEAYHFIPGAFLFGVEDAGDVTPLADANDKTRTSEAPARELVRRRLEAQRSLARRWSFSTNALDLAPSMTLRIVDVPLLEQQKLLVLSTAINGERDGIWRCSVTALPADKPYRPPLLTPRPILHGLEPATVVGPEGEEIHVDEFGRVKVQFHWDRQGERNEHSSCWVPVSSSWAGAGYGAVMLPRIGHEVLVGFLGGDPDRPIITGRVYSHLHPTPYKLPDEKTVTVVAKTRSFGGSEGYNEIKADDKAGAELLSVQAERDLQTLVKRQEQRTVGVSRTTKVGKDDTLDIAQNRQMVVGGQEQRIFTSPKPDAPRTVQTNENGLNRMEVGGSVVEVTPGAVKINAPMVEIDCTFFRVNGTNGFVEMEMDLNLEGGGVKVTSSRSDVDVKSAGFIKLNCD